MSDMVRVTIRVPREVCDEFERLATLAGVRSSLLEQIGLVVGVRLVARYLTLRGVDDAEVRSLIESAKNAGEVST